MPTPAQFKAPFDFDQHYHMLFRSIDGIPLFKTENEYFFFLEKWKRFTDPVFVTWAYSMLDNHAHLIVKVKQLEEVLETLNALTPEAKTKIIRQFLKTKEPSLIGRVIERQINSFMVSYVKTYNSIFERKGGLFQRPFRRSIISNEAHLQQTIVYAHANVQKHGLLGDFRLHPHHSYFAILLGDSTYINSEAVLQFFGGINQFVSIHTEQVAYFYLIR
jgi:putative transposase